MAMVRDVRVVGLVGLVAAIAMAGCKTDSAVKKPEVIGRGQQPLGTPPTTEPQSASGAVPNINPVGAGPGYSGPTGSVAGTVSLLGKVPAKVEIDTSMDPACGLAGGTVYSEQYVVNAGKLANVFVYVKSGPPAAMQAGSSGGGGAMKPVVLDQKGCQYVPHVIGVMQGGYVEFRNSDPTMHNIHTMPTVVGNETVDVSQGPKGTPVTKQFAKPEMMMPVRCNNHPWMNAFINVSQTPFFAVTDAAGKFSLAGLPPGEYVIGAVQEKMGEKTIPVTVGAGGVGKADFSFAVK